MVIQSYNCHSITAKGVDETVNWRMKHPDFSKRISLMRMLKPPKSPPLDSYRTLLRVQFPSGLTLPSSRDTCG